MRRSWLALTWGAALGCASAPAAPSRVAGGPPPEAATDYFPLSPGWKWAYQLEKGGERILATYAVLERLADTAIVQAGEERIVYVVLPEGIARREGLNVGDFLLKTPVRAGAAWPIAGGEAKLVAVGETVTVPAGTFTNCATVEESRSDPRRVLRTVYAPAVGPVSLEMTVHDASGSAQVALRAALLGVTRPGDDPLGPSEATAPPRPATPQP